MDKVKSSIKDFTARVGHHDTTVHETVAPAVQREVVKPHQHEEVNTAIDKEVHQDHYHRTVQPVKDREVLPEQHTANLGAVQHREFDHRDHDSTKRALATEQGTFKDERVVEGTSHSQSANATIGGEHVHHHVHETIQPVVQKETIQPSVVHTTVPIHEVHHNAAKHHSTSALPAVTMDQFKQRGGVLGGREERYDGFEGEPKNIGGIAHDLAHNRDPHHGDQGTKTYAQHGDFDPRDGNLTKPAAGGVSAEPGMRNAVRRRSSSASSSDVEREHNSYKEGAPVAGRGPQAGTVKEPSLMDKLNPRVDANGDGQAGFMK